jgi:SAM-dependent methyltransferase
MIPLRFKDSQLFTTLREFFKDTDYTEKAVCERLGWNTMHQALTCMPGSQSVSRTVDRLQVLIRLFLTGENVEEAEIRALIPGKVLESMNALGLTSYGPSEADHCHATVALYPLRGLYIVSDRWTSPDRSAFTAFDDIVYPALASTTGRFLEVLPPDPCDSLLELCSGTGIAALAAAAEYARHAWAIDITERSTEFAEFNRLLNGLNNVTVAKGSLYEPVGERTFERIVAHPPYVPTLEPAEIYYGGGEDGERVTRGIVQGLPRYLRPGGRLYCLALGTEREAEPFELRVRQWLGDRQSDFDVLFVVTKVHDPSEVAFQSAVKSRGGTAEVEQWKALFERLKVKNLVYGAIVVQRKNTERPSFTVRREKGPHFGYPEIEWLMRWESASASPKTSKLLLESQPSAAPDLELQVLHRFADRTLTPSEFRLRIDFPFSMECRCQPWMAAFVARCDGKKTILEHFEACKQDNLIQPDTPIEEFTNLLRLLISGGFLQVDGFLPPKTGGGSESAK